MGTGHVGLVTAAAFASLGHEVVGTDVDGERIELLRQGTPHFHEPGLREAMAREMASGRLSFDSDPASALAEAEIVLICVGTPARDDGGANLMALEQVGGTIARNAPDGAVVVEKSTVPVGTSERLRLTLQREGRGRRFNVASNPEFLREGRALEDALKPDRVVIGVDSQRALDVLRHLYEPMTRAGTRLIVTDIPTAELAKYASNAFLALKISFANGLAHLCERVGADVTAVADVMGVDPRIGRAFLDAGLGFGGHCLPKDVAALEHLSDRVGYSFGLLAEISRLNEEAAETVVSKVRDALWNLEGKRIALLGLAFKPGTDDVRESPAIRVARRLLASGASVVGCDPLAALPAKDEVPELELANDPYEAAAGAHCLVLATEWEEFGRLSPDSLKSVMAYPIVVDGRNLFDPGEMRRAGFWYYPTGRAAILQPTVVAPDGPLDGNGERSADLHHVELA